jgi:hypothetical protein
MKKEKKGNCMKSFLKDYEKRIAAVFLVAAVLAIGTSQAALIGLGTAANFAVLGCSAVDNIGSSVINGDLGIWSGSAITGFGPGVVNGTIHTTDLAAQQAQSDVTTAYDSLAAMPFGTDFTATPTLGGRILTAGVYHFDAAADLTGILTLDGPGDFVFQIGSAITTASGSSVLVTNGANADNVYWQVGSSATLGTTTAFKGNILALTSITLDTGATIDSGRALARNGAVTLDGNIITIPEPATLCLLGFGALSLICRKKLA